MQIHKEAGKIAKDQAGGWDSPPPPATVVMWSKPPGVLQLHNSHVRVEDLGLRRNKPAHCASIKLPLTTESAMEKGEDSHTLCSVDVKANEHQIQQAVRKLYDTAVAEVNTLIRPEEREGIRSTGS
ncbi:hypothetical protein QTO34_003464 [Cnephaeus nilssonii]|uniref:Uncharacterized protein n=1 Tax=Cnephaeus nilssonii TaxID=3371016 RepID=A0AA40LJB7_CNENI|nr:hypothetical protein QTO34_003464 [Eptesicus nilssonii]